MSDILEVKKNESLKNYCTMKVGGTAKFVFICHSLLSLKSACLYCKKNNLKFKVIGLGANLIFDDLGFDGAIIVNRSKQILFRNNFVYADSGVSITSLIQKCYLKGLSNLENLNGIPATVGGGIVNNLGAFGTELGDFVEYVVCYDILHEKEIKLTPDQCLFSYRKSIFQMENLIVLRVKLKMEQEERKIIKLRLDQAIQKKINSQPLNLPSSGSVFKRSTIIPAQTIDQLGLKGTRIGDAEISTKHAGFIVNLGNATKKDILSLVTLIKNRVKSATNVDLSTEIEFVEF